MKTRLTILAAAALLAFAMPVLSPVAAYADDETPAVTAPATSDDAAQTPAADGSEATAPAQDETQAAPAQDDSAQPADEGTTDDNGAGDTDQ